MTRLALLVVAAAVLIGLWGSTVEDAPRQTRVTWMALAVFLGTAFCLWSLPEGRDLLRRRRLLLVPVAVSLLPGLIASFGVATGLSSVLHAGPHFQLGIFALNLSVWFVAFLVCSVFTAAWASRAILACGTNASDREALEAGLPRGLSPLVRTFAVILFGYAVPMLMLALVLGVGIWMGPLIPIVLALFALAWNLLTAPLLLIAMGCERPLGQVLRMGIRFGKETFGQWLLPTLAQMVCLGWVVYVRTRFSRPGHVQSSSSFEANVNWTGSYPTESNWVTEYAEVLETATFAPADTALALVLFALAVAIKLRIAGLLRERGVLPD